MDMAMMMLMLTGQEVEVKNNMCDENETKTSFKYEELFY
jgi:hypothetical protein